MHPSTRARLAALVLGLGAVALFVYDQPGPGLVLLAVAAAVAILVPDRSLSHDIAQALVAGNQQAWQDAAEAMRFEGRGILVPHRQGIALFCPARDIDVEQAPAFDGHTRLVQRPPAVGMFITPPGQGLFDADVQYRGDVPPGLEGATARLRQALPAMGLGGHVTVEHGHDVRITYRPTLTLPDDAADRWHLLGADAVTSYIGMVLATATKRPVKLLARDEVDAGPRSTWRMA